MIYIFVIIYGGLIGSFLNALIDRMHTGESIKTNRSHCDSCGHILGVLDLIPVISWSVMRGKCRYCHAAIPVKNVIIELITIGLFIIVFNNFFPNESIETTAGLIGMFISMLVIVCAFLVLFVYDLEHQILPDRIVIILLLSSITLHLFSIAHTGSTFWGISVSNLLLSGVGSALPYFLLILITKGAGMGGGDLKLAFVMGILFGYPRIFVAQYVAFLLGGVVALLLLMMGKKRFGQTIAFGPFMVLASYIVLFWGDWLLERFVYWIP